MSRCASSCVARAAIDRQNCADEPADSLDRLHDLSAELAHEIGGDVDPERRCNRRQHGRERRYDRSPDGHRLAPVEMLCSSSLSAASGATPFQSAWTLSVMPRLVGPPGS